MASTTADETAAEAPGRGRTADTDEAAKKGAEGIQDEQQHEKGQRMNTPDGPDEPKEQRAAVLTKEAEKADSTEGAERTGQAGRAAPEGAPDAAGDVEEVGRAGEQPGGGEPADATEAGGRATDAAGETDTAAGAEAGADGTEDGADGTRPVAAAVPDAGSGPLGKQDGPDKAPSVVAQGAGAVVAAALGVVSLTGSWLGTVAGERESLIGRLTTAEGASVSHQMQALYGDQWHATALVGGVFALLALIVGVVVLARPAFGQPGEPQAPWIKSVSWAGVALGVIGLLLAVLKYSDAILGLPSVQS